MVCSASSGGSVRLICPVAHASPGDEPRGVKQMLYQPETRTGGDRRRGRIPGTPNDCQVSFNARTPCHRTWSRRSRYAGGRVALGCHVGEGDDQGRCGDMVWPAASHMPSRPALEEAISGWFHPSCFMTPPPAGFAWILVSP